jgi:hypothetical protein
MDEPKAKASDFSTTSSDSDSDSETKWPCANCHSVVHVQDERCPVCHGIQVKIPPESPVVYRRFLERLSPATVTPLRERPVLMVAAATDAATDTDTAANPLVFFTEFEDDDLSVSVGSPDHDIILEVDLRPTDPVGLTLAAVPSPLPGQKIKIDSKVVATLVKESTVTAVDFATKRKKSGAFSEMKETHKKPKISTEAT